MSEKEIIVVEGNNVLSGEVRVSGAKNSALKLIAASLLGQGASTLHNVPLISDIVVMSEVLECLGEHLVVEGFQHLAEAILVEIVQLAGDVGGVHVDEPRDEVRGRALALGL